MTDTCLIEKLKDQPVSHQVKIEYWDGGLGEDCPLPTRGSNERWAVYEFLLRPSMRIKFRIMSDGVFTIQLSHPSKMHNVEKK